MLKAKYNDYEETTRDRVRRIIDKAIIWIVGNTHDRLFMYHKKNQQ
jgi:hypothetical protein